MDNWSQIQEVESFKTSPHCEELPPQQSINFAVNLLALMIDVLIALGLQAGRAFK